MTAIDDAGVPTGATDAQSSAPWSRTNAAAVDPTTYLRPPSMVDRARGSMRVITGPGWLAIVMAVGGWLLAWQLGWEEMALLAAVALVCLALALLWVVGRTHVTVDVDVQPQRVVVGDRSAAEVVVTNGSGRRLLPLRMELVVGAGTAEFDVGSLAPGASHEELFVLPTQRRAVIPVGPATAVRGDPLGLLRRVSRCTEPVPLIVHPRIVALDHLGAGLMRDLEGQATPDLSPADVAFHALRDYEPGDDRRFIHWLTTARVNRLVVRQFNDTRRTHVAVLLDTDRRIYADDHAFETAVSVVGSLGIRALGDEQELTVATGGTRVPSFAGQVLLDALAAVESRPRHQPLPAQAETLARDATGVSLAIIVTGAATPTADLRAAALRFDTSVRTIAVRIDPSAATGFRKIGPTDVLTLASIGDLGRLLWAVVQG